MSEDLKLNNFRLSYYDKVAHRGISAEKALISILKDDKIDLNKLLDFCVHFPIPEGYRMLIWKIVLDILPIHQQSHKFVMSQRIEQYNDLHNALIVMQIINNDTPIAETFLKMFLLENGLLKIEDKQKNKFFVAVATTASEIMESMPEAYWLSIRVYELFKKNKYHEETKEFIEIIKLNLNKTNSKLLSHLEKLDFFNHFPQTWFKFGFSGVFQSSMEQIWDLLFGNASKILAYVALQILVNFERKILLTETLETCLKCFHEIPFDEDLSDIIVSQGIEKWVKLEKINN